MNPRSETLVIILKVFVTAVIMTAGKIVIDEITGAKK